MYIRDPVNVLRRQIERTPYNDIITSPIAGDVSLHGMPSMVGREACAAAKQKIEQSVDEAVFWKYHYCDEE